MAVTCDTPQNTRNANWHGNQELAGQFFSFNKSLKSLWINLGDGKVQFSGGKGPQKKMKKRKSE